MTMKERPIIMTAENRRAVPAPQWTTEPPTEEGYYWVPWIDRLIIVDVYFDLKGKLTVKGRWKECPFEYYMKNFQRSNDAWLKIQTPPLSTQEDAQ